MGKKKEENLKEKRELVIDYLKKEQILVVGVDQGYAELGFALIKYDIATDDFEIIKVLEPKTRSTDILNKRIHSIYNISRELITLNDVSVVGCEKLFFNAPIKTNSENSLKTSMMIRNKSASILKTNMVTGLLYSITGELDIPIFEYPPTTVKKQVTNNGRATKEQLTGALKKIIDDSGVTVKKSHGADAIGIAITTARSYCQHIYDSLKKSKKE